MKTPRGIRCKNPGNIRKGAPWQGLDENPQPIDPDFAQFRDPSWGIRALAITLITYYDKHGIRNIDGIIRRWAPSNENDTEAYIESVSAISGFTSTQTLNLHVYAHMRPIVDAIIRHENGRGPMKNANTWYDNATIDTGLQRAGIVKSAASVAAVPVTKETVAASGTASLGVAQLADVAPQIIAAVDGNQSNLSSGSWVRIMLGVATIGLAAFIAYSQVKKHQNGVVS